MIVRLFSQNKVKVDVKYMRCITTNWMNKLFVILVTLGLSSISSATNISSSTTSENNGTSKTQVKQDNNELEKLTILLEVLQVDSNNAILKFENENLKNTVRRIEEKNKKQSEDYYQFKLHLGLIVFSLLAIMFYLKHFVLIGMKRDNED